MKQSDSFLINLKGCEITGLNEKKCVIFYAFDFFLDIIGNCIGFGSFGYVYEAVEKESQKKVAIKGFLPNDDPKSMERDLDIGIDPRLYSEYTMTYVEVFNFQGYLFAVMPLMKTSLDKNLNPYLLSRGKKLLSDTV
jgi:serine/threonine protein kinase